MELCKFEALYDGLSFTDSCYHQIGPFWFPSMFDSIGLNGAAALCSALMLVFGVVPTALQQFWIGPKQRR